MVNKLFVFNLHEKGFGNTKIASILGISRQRVHQILKGYKSLPNTGRYKTLREHILMRDDYKCQRCGEIQDLLIHHADFNSSNNTMTNLVTLCNNCHLQAHYGGPIRTRPSSYIHTGAYGSGLRCPKCNSTQTYTRKNGIMFCRSCGYNGLVNSDY